MLKFPSCRIQWNWEIRPSWHSTVTILPTASN